MCHGYNDFGCLPYSGKILLSFIVCRADADMAVGFPLEAFFVNFSTSYLKRSQIVAFGWVVGLEPMMATIKGIAIA